MTIKINFLIGYSITALLFGTLGIIVLLGLFQIHLKIAEIDQNKIPALLKTDDMYEELTESIVEAHSYITHGDEPHKENFREKMTSYDRQETEFRQLAKIGQAGEDPEEKELFTNLHNAKEDYRRSTEGLFAIFEKNHKLESNDFDNFEANTQTVHSFIDKLLDSRRKNLEMASSGVNQMIRQIMLLMVGVALLVGIIAGGIALFMLRSISKPLEALQNSVVAITSGDLSKRARIIGRNEIGKLAENFNLMADKVEQSEEDLKGKNVALEQQSLKLKDQLEQLEKFQKVTVDRELKMIELKEKIAGLEKGKK